MDYPSFVACPCPAGRQGAIIMYDHPQGPPPPNHLAWAILSTLFCCLPFGVVAIVNAASVNSRHLMGDVHGAREASASARTWCLVSTWIGVIVIGLYIVFYGAAMSSSTR
jgi:predicted secreted protein